MIFTDAEMQRRISAFRAAMASLGIDAAFIHTADNVFYLSGVPLLSEWGRPLWLVVGHDDLHVICARIETETARACGYRAEVHAYDDDRPAIEQATRLMARLLQSIGADRGVTGIERQRLPLGIVEQLNAFLPGARFADTGDALDRLRILKSAEELELLRVAAEIAKTGARAFLGAVSDGVTELAVATHAVAAMETALAEPYPAGDVGRAWHLPAGRGRLPALRRAVPNAGRRRHRHRLPPRPRTLGSLRGPRAGTRDPPHRPPDQTRTACGPPMKARGVRARRNQGMRLVYQHARCVLFRSSGDSRE